MRVGAPLLHSRNRLDAWQTWHCLTGGSVSDGRAQVFDHFYFSLQAAVAGIGVAIGPWQLVRDDIAIGILCAPCGFIEDGSGYELLAPVRSSQGTRTRRCSTGCARVASDRQNRLRGDVSSGIQSSCFDRRARLIARVRRP